MPSNTNMENKAACNDLPSFALANDLAIELRGPTEIGTGLVYAHSEVENLAPLECALQLNTTGNAETRRGSALVAGKVVFCFAVVVVMVVLGLPLVLFSLYGTKQLEVLVLGEGNDMNGARNSAFASGGTLPVKMQRRDGTDPQSSSGGMMGALTTVLAIVIALTCLAVVVLTILVCKFVYFDWTNICR